MKTEAFKKWLLTEYVQEKGTLKGKPLTKETQASRVANCSTVEQSEGDLDEHFQRDKMEGLIERLAYSATHVRKGILPTHKIQIEGNQLTGTQTYRNAIRLYFRFLNETLGEEIIDTELTALEGEERMALVRHRKREQSLRDAKVLEARKSGSGKLKCEVPKCGFDFEVVYGELGRDYAQVHHLKPLADRTNPSQTKLDDLAVVCANCHVMIHRGGKCRSLDGLIS